MRSFLLKPALLLFAAFGLPYPSHASDFSYEYAQSLYDNGVIADWSQWEAHPYFRLVGQTGRAEMGAFDDGAKDKYCSDGAIKGSTLSFKFFTASKVNFEGQTVYSKTAQAYFPKAAGKFEISFTPEGMIQWDIPIQQSWMGVAMSSSTKRNFSCKFVRGNSSRAICAVRIFLNGEKHTNFDSSLDGQIVGYAGLEVFNEPYSDSTYLVYLKDGFSFKIPFNIKPIKTWISDSGSTFSAFTANLQNGKVVQADELDKSLPYCYLATPYPKELIPSGAIIRQTRFGIENESTLEMVSEATQVDPDFYIVPVSQAEHMRHIYCYTGSDGGKTMTVGQFQKAMGVKLNFNP